VAKRPTIDRAFDRYWRHLRRLDGKYDMVVSASPGLSARLVEGGLRHVVTNPMGVDPGVFSPRLRDEDLRRRLLAMCELPESATLLLGVGRFAPEKRWPMLVEAVEAAGRAIRSGWCWWDRAGPQGNRAPRFGQSAYPHPEADHRSRRTCPRDGQRRRAGPRVRGGNVLHGRRRSARQRPTADRARRRRRGGSGRASGGWTYASASAAAAADAIADYAARRERGETGPHAIIPPPRTMDDHFAELFASYERLVTPHRRAA
jgi:alpha-1,6-mannosyltransferase